MCSLRYSTAFGGEIFQIAQNSNQNPSVKQWGSKVDVDPIKKWTISCNIELNENSIRNAVEVKDSNGSKISTEILLSKDEKSIIVKAPRGGYDAGGTYYLNVSIDLKSKAKMIPLKEAITMKFTIQNTTRMGWKLLWNDEFSAVGGEWPGRPESTTSFLQNMYVDYVRVYSR